MVRLGSPACKAAERAGLSPELCNKYHWYVDRKLKVRKTRRQSNFKDQSMNRVYRCEDKALRNFKSGGGEVLKFDKDGAVKYVKRITKSKLWQELTKDSGRKNPTVKFFTERKERTLGMATWSGELFLNPRTGLTQYVILHEMAHLCGNMHHDIGFRIDLVRLCSRFMGREMARQLKASFRKDGLKMNVPKSVKTPEEWYKSYLKMEKMRAKNPRFAQE